MVRNLLCQVSGILVKCGISSGGYFKERRKKTLPAIALDGDLMYEMYESLIPGQDELISEITRRWQLKNR